MRKLPIRQNMSDLESEDHGPRPKRHELKVTINLLLPWYWWRKRKEKRHEESGYGWAYECGCSAKAGACSDPYCSVHGMRLMRFKKKEPHSIKRTVVLLIGLPIL